jgi:hypothetical protein
MRNRLSLHAMTLFEEPQGYTTILKWAGSTLPQEEKVSFGSTMRIADCAGNPRIVFSVPYT